jgi:hypothetical protein
MRIAPVFPLRDQRGQITAGHHISTFGGRFELHRIFKSVHENFLEVGDLDAQLRADCVQRSGLEFVLGLRKMVYAPPKRTVWWLPLPRAASRETGIPRLLPSARSLRKNSFSVTLALSDENVRKST